MAAIAERKQDRNQELLKDSKGILIIITGPTGAGKDTIMNELLEVSENLSRIVTYTSRPMREHEQEGVDYHFTTKEKFEEMIIEGHFLEHVVYGNHYKGTHKDSIRQVLDGQDVIWRIDMSRAATIEDTLRSAYGDEAQQIIERTVVIVIGTPTLTHLKDRVKSREGEKFDEQEFVKRLKTDWEIWQNNQFDNVINNEDGKLQEAVESVFNIIEQHRQRI